MNRRTRKTSEWTFLVIPGAGASVMQTRFKVRSLLLSAVLMAVLTGSAGIWLSQKLNGSEKHIHHLTSRLAEQEETAAEELAEADRTIRRLMGEMNALADRAEQVEAKLAELEALERQIRQLTNAGEDSGGESDLPLASAGEGGAYISTDGLDVRLQELSARIDDLRRSLRELEHALRATPSIWPVHARTITSGFGLRRDPFTGRRALHNGIDIGAARGEPVFSTADGNVLRQGRDAVYGNYIIIEHSEAVRTVYMHLLEIAVKDGERVEKGQQIGSVGSTGRSTGFHLHYEVHIDGEPVDPVPYLSINASERTDE